MGRLFIDQELLAKALAEDSESVVHFLDSMANWTNEPYAFHIGEQHFYSGLFCDYCEKKRDTVKGERDCIKSNMELIS